MALSAQFLRDRLEEYTQLAEAAPKDPFKNKREVSEAYENLGLCQFYSGDYKHSLVQFVNAYELKKEYSQDRGNSKLCILAGLSCFRIGEVAHSEYYLDLAVTAAQHADATDMIVTAKANLAMVYAHQLELQRAMDCAKEALALAAQIYLKTSDELREVVRVCVCIYLHAGEHRSAEILVSNSSFTPQEAALILAGCRVMAGRPEEAEAILLTYQKETENGALAQTMPSTINTLTQPYPRSRLMSAISPSPSPMGSRRGSMLNSPSDLNRNSSVISQNTMFKDALARVGSDAGESGDRVSNLYTNDAALRTASIVGNNNMSSLMPSSSDLPPVIETDMKQKKLQDAQIEYNIAVTSFRRKKAPRAKIHLEKALQLAIAVEGPKPLEDESQSATTATESETTPCTASVPVPVVEDGGTLDLLTVDAILTPKVVLSHILVANAEMLLASKPIRTAVHIQTSDALEHLEWEDNLLAEVAMLLDSSVEALACPDLIGLPRDYQTAQGSVSSPISGIDPALWTAGASLPSLTSVKSGSPKLVSPGSRPGSKQGSMNSTAVSTITTKKSKKLKKKTKWQSLTANEKSLGGSSKPSSPDHTSKSKSRAETPVDNNTPIINSDIILASDIRDRYNHLVMMTHSEGNRDIVRSEEMANLRNKFSTNSRGVSRRTTARAGGSVTKLTSLDLGTESVRNEIMPNKVIHESSEAHSWIQWALAVSEGMGFGFMGLQGTVDEDDNSVKHTPDFYREVKSHLDDAQEFVSKDDYPTLMSISCVLLKICAQLNLRKDAGIYVEKYERYADQLEEDHHRALSKKYRFDFEEWNASFNQQTGAANKLRRLMLLLGHAKTYHYAAERTHDLQLQRDALKRVINVLTEVSQVSDGRSIFPASQLQSDLDNMSTEEIDEKEGSDVYWMRKYAKLRALEFFHKMKLKKIKDVQPTSKSILTSPNINIEEIGNFEEDDNSSLDSESL